MYLLAAIVGKFIAAVWYSYIAKIKKFPPVGFIP